MRPVVNEGTVLRTLGIGLLLAWVAMVGRDLSWDVINHHLYLPYSLLTGRYRTDGGGRENFSVSVGTVGATAAQSIYYLPKSDFSVAILASRAVDGGSMRGYGTLQTMSATEMMMDEAAGLLGMRRAQAGRAGDVMRVAQVAAEFALKRLESGRHHATCLWRPAAWDCRRAMWPTSALSAARSGMLKSRSRQVGTGRPMRS